MGKVILAVGPTTSGKSQWLEKWREEQPEKREIVTNVVDAWTALGQGKDVGIEAGAFGPHEVEVVTFSA